MASFIFASLEEFGFTQYEISNFSKNEKARSKYTTLDIGKKRIIWGLVLVLLDVSKMKGIIQKRCPSIHQRTTNL